MLHQLLALLREMGRNCRDFLPILGVVVFFQWFIVGQPMADLGERIAGIVVTLIGLTLFVRGLEMSIFPIGESLAGGLARRGSLILLIAFGFALGFGSTVAEPALASVADQAAATASSAGRLGGTAADIERFSDLLRYIVAAAVGLAVAAGVFRIVKGWPTAWFVVPGYALATVIALSHDSPLAAVAFDAGAAATSAVNIPLMMTLGTGLASLIDARDPITDGFGLIAGASLMPMIVIQLAAVALGG
ncbi:MAG TPA: DUF1538 family protein [Gammaproteobacteria bacterium]